MIAVSGLPEQVPVRRRLIERFQYQRLRILPRPVVHLLGLTFSRLGI
jgi:hypothetical protein